jgi:AraC family L-rhamnose operon regulatory protein RhaS
MDEFRYSTVKKNKGAQKENTLRVEPLRAVLYEDGYTPESLVSDRLRIVLVETGAGTLKVEGKTIPWVAPCIMCFDEQRPVESPFLAGPLRVLYFHPQALNAALDFTTIKDTGDSTDPAVMENRLLFRAFIPAYNRPPVTAIPPENGVRARGIFDSIRKELDDQETGWWPCLSRSYLAELLFLVARAQDALKARGADVLPSLGGDAFQPMLDYLMRNYGKKITLEGLAAEFGTNRTSLNERFKKETGMTAIAYLIDLRLRLASALLVDTALPVAEVADRSGMTDTTHFERMFKKKFGMSPKDYRLTARGAKN